MNKEQFIEKLECWIKQDLINMLGIKAINNCGGCNFPIVLYILTSMEWIGFIARDCNCTKSQRDATHENIGECLKYFNNPKYANKHIKNIIIKIFRHGLVHQFGPKAAGISRGNCLEFAIYTYNDLPVIDADLFASDFIEAIDNCIEKVVQDDKFFNRVKEKLNYLFAEDKKDLYKLADEINTSDKNK